MDVFEAVQTRRSIRAYQERAVEKEKLVKVLEAGRLSPSAANQQPWHFIAVTDKAARERLFTAYNRRWFVDAPAIIVACALPEKSWSRQDGEEYWKVDVAIALQSMVLVARELGLGTCWIGAFNEEKVKEALGIPQKVRVVALTPLGYPAEQKGPVADRKPLEEIVHYDRW
ncbi:nitroreductase [Candidatus Bathyarchaeota archaeon A05DMB-2]|nr:nitroreductase [Candidatus Bathyarchaeota archaeon A05DMB-2]